MAKCEGRAAPKAAPTKRCSHTLDSACCLCAFATSEASWLLLRLLRRRCAAASRRRLLSSQAYSGAHSTTTRRGRGEHLHLVYETSASAPGAAPPEDRHSSYRCHAHARARHREPGRWPWQTSWRASRQSPPIRPTSLVRHQAGPVGRKRRFASSAASRVWPASVPIGRTRSFTCGKQHQLSDRCASCRHSGTTFAGFGACPGRQRGRIEAGPAHPGGLG